MKKRYKKQAKVAMAVALATSSVVNSARYILAQEETEVNEYNSIDNEEVKEEQKVEEPLEVKEEQEVERKNLDTIGSEEIQNTDQIEEVVINEENFPDAKFREYISGSSFDTNQDGILSSIELDAVKEINVTTSYVTNPRELTSLKGIEYFENLEKLYFNGTGIIKVDVSKNTALKEIQAIDTYLEEIDVSKNIALRRLLCYNMPNLTSIDVQGASALEYLDCANAPKLKGLDVSRNLNLNTLWIKGKSWLDTNLAWLKMGTHPNLRAVNLHNEKSIIDIGKVHETFNLKELFPEIELDRITSITGAEIDLTTGVVSNYRNNQKIEYKYRSGIIENNQEVFQIVQLNLQRYAEPIGQEVVVVQGKEVDPADGIANKNELPEGTTYEWEGGAPDTSEIGIVTGNILLHYPGDFHNRVNNVRVNVGIEINEENFPDAKFREYISGSAFDKNQDGILSSTELSAVEHISVAGISNPRELTSLKGIEYFKNLKILYCNGTGLTSVDLSKNTALIEIYAYNSYLEKLDVSQNTALQYLSVYSTFLEEIDVSKNIVLRDLLCYSMPNLTRINVEGASELTRLECTDNPKMRGLDVSRNLNLNKLWIRDSKYIGTNVAWLHIGENSKLSTINNVNTSMDVTINSTIDMGEVARTFNIKEQFPGIDPTKIISISGASIDKETGVVVRNSATVNYAYDSGIKSGNSKVVLNVTLNFTRQNADDYTPEGQSITMFKGEIPNAEEGIANKDALPQGTTYTWAQEPNTSEEGIVQGTIVVTYPDGSSEEVTIDIQVVVKDEDKYAPIVDNNKEINKGENPKAEDFIVNKDELPNGTQYEWFEEPDTSVEGTTTGVLKVTYPDGTSDICDVTMNVVSKEETSPEQGWITIEGTLDKRYDGQAVLEPTVKKPEGSGEVTFEWYTADGIKLDTAPVDAGSYKVKVILEANENYTGAEVEKEFEIYKATTSVSIIGELSKEYDGKPVATPEVKVVGSTGQVSYEWYRKEETARATTWTRLEEAPVEIGSYKLVVRVAGDKNYEGAMAEKEFTISKVGENTPDNPVVVPTPPTGGTITNPDGG
ncbi:MAG: MBG domain-containing protein, partial [Erysipelotrichaceae bacterium]|nr:MBG domain-containing protein [Erysipelotrichaceae bacterium]